MEKEENNLILKWIETDGRFSITCDQGDDFCDFLFVFLCPYPLLKKDLH